MQNVCVCVWGGGGGGFQENLDFRPSKNIFDAIVMVGAGQLTANLATVVASYSEWFTQHLQN